MTKVVSIPFMNRPRLKHSPLAVAGTIDTAWARAERQTTFAAVGKVYTVCSTHTAGDMLSESAGKLERSQLGVD